MCEGMTVSGETLAAVLSSSAGNVATSETEPEIGFEVAGSAVRKVVWMREFRVGEEEDVFAGLEVEGECLDVGLLCHCLGSENSRDDDGELCKAEVS